jgi:hypothetical protein
MQDVVMTDLPLLGHLAAGSVTFALFWGAVLTVKGGPAHRRRGRLFFLSLLPVGASVGAILMVRSVHFDPVRMLQFLYLLLCLMTVGTIGWTSIRWKHDLDRFRGWHFGLLGLAMVSSGATVLSAGVFSRQPLPIILSGIGLVYGGAMVRFAWMHAAPHPRWWLGWHLNSVLLLSSAVHGTLLAVLYRALIDPHGFDIAQLVTQPGTLLLAVALRVHLGRQRGVPMRFAVNREPDFARA